MNKNGIIELINTIQRMKQGKAFKNYIEYIVFPYYKNLFPNSKIDFEFPLTVLVGKNGSGKSSTLHALYGAPLNKSCSDFWFSTEVDPINENSDKERNRFFYGYREDSNSNIKEVKKQRSKRKGSKTKKEDPDYWETAKPKKTDGMIGGKKRNSPVNKEVVYLDFRAEVSAFDKIFHFSKEKLNERKKLLRERSKYLKRLFDNKPMKFPGVKDEKIGKLVEVSDKLIKQISYILGKDYVDIKIAEHSLFKNKGTSILVKTRVSSNYSEANAGSGEVAVIQLVKKITEAPEYSLILLDEPEVSIHPGAQEKLKKFLLENIKEKKLQVVISTHSPIFLKDLPSSAIKLYITNNDGKFEIKQNINYEEAFFDIEDSVAHKKIIFCEDYATKCMIESTLQFIKKDVFLDVIFVSGGEATLIAKYLPTIVSHKDFENKIFMVLDGDMKKEFLFNEKKLTVENSKNSNYLKECVKKAFGQEINVFPDSGNNKEQQKCEMYIKYLKYHNNSIYYLPDLTPELMLLKNDDIKNIYKEKFDKYPINFECNNNESQKVAKDNAKKIIDEIIEKEYTSLEFKKAGIKRLSNLWIQKESEDIKKLIEILNKILN
ncbi:ATP-dependent nuclease [Leptotrichia sp. oral taxon 847]|uniref:ATP-dependent nuclease n=1 Tax=Leptotrichia sp. oral taxon 847 TaxID=1785996 RepID=UPI000767FA8B|nr:ATP-binding protein [Leptotrichia sp. oral taxon 847]AMD94641.1 hypothetical protein AXF11_02865 [Leptotrichia sp. oral taxon 847]